MESHTENTEITLNKSTHESISPTSISDNKSNEYVLNISPRQPVANKASQKCGEDSEELGEDTEVIFTKRNSTHGRSQSINSGTQDEKTTDSEISTSLTQSEEDATSTKHIISILPSPKISPLDAAVIGSSTNGEPGTNPPTQITTDHTTKKGYPLKINSI